MGRVIDQLIAKQQADEAEQIIASHESAESPDPFKGNPKALIEYQIRPVTRYQVVRFERSRPNEAGLCQTSQVQNKGEYLNQETAYEVAYALCKQESEHLGYPPFDDRIQYPDPLTIDPTQFTRRVIR